MGFRRGFWRIGSLFDPVPDLDKCPQHLTTTFSQLILLLQAQELFMLWLLPVIALVYDYCFWSKRPVL